MDIVDEGVRGVPVAVAGGGGVVDDNSCGQVGRAFCHGTTADRIKNQWRSCSERLRLGARRLVTELRRCRQPEDHLFTRETGEPVRDFRGLGCAGGRCETSRPAFSRSAALGSAQHDSPGSGAKDGAANLRTQTGSVFSPYKIISEADIADAARRIEEGAKAAVIQSSFIAEPENEVNDGKGKPAAVYNQ